MWFYGTVSYFFITTCTIEKFKAGEGLSERDDSVIIFFFLHEDFRRRVIKISDVVYGRKLTIKGVKR